MFEFGFYKGYGWCPGEKFSIKHYNNGWHRFIEIIVPAFWSRDKFHSYISYQITYWNNYTNLFGKEKINNDPIGPSCKNNKT